ncbi:MAG: type II toxin-antitoxin system Phd/YefM family antitoxin [Micromonosporaceae bacterium]
MSATPVERIGIRELRQNASKYIEMAERGVDVVVTRRGKIVAHIVPHGERPKDPLQELYDSGRLRRAENPGSLLDIVPVKSTSGISATEVLLQMREEERF